MLAVHSGAGAPGYAATDRIPERIAAMVYVDTGPARARSIPSFDGVEKPLPSLEELAAEENLDGLSHEQLATFQRRAVPEPGAALREAAELTNDARLGIPSTVVCTAFTAEQYKEAIEEGYAFLAGLAELRDVSYVELPTSHWPMWSRPSDLADDHRRDRNEVTVAPRQRPRGLVELAGIEPASSDVDSGILRAQFVVSFSQPRRSHEHVADRLSRC